jgi:long-chain acyl-CoA synthetase
VVAAPLEDQIILSRYIAQAFICGNNRHHTMAIIVPEYEGVWLSLKFCRSVPCNLDLLFLMMQLRTWARKANLSIDLKDNKALLASKHIQDLITSEIKMYSEQMKHYERPKAWIFAREPFSPDNQMMTPKMSLRRKNIEAAYQDVIEDVYAGKLGITGF